MKIDNFPSMKNARKPCTIIIFVHNTMLTMTADKGADVSLLLRVWVCGAGMPHINAGLTTVLTVLIFDDAPQRREQPS